MNNDLISREALRNVILKDRKLDGVNANWEVNRILVHIDNAPTISLQDIYQEGHYDGHLEGYTKAINEERPQGEWVAHEDMDEWYECNKCHYGNTYFDKLPNFCPNCGAKMKGDTE